MTSTSFKDKKEAILHRLAQPVDNYKDLSPKGSIDEPIRNLINKINHIPELVTTSSCSGRISVFLEGHKIAPLAQQNKEHSNGSLSASSGGKGGGQWLYVSHDPIELNLLQSEGLLLNALKLHPKGKESFDPGSGDSTVRFVHLKFEAMILHILTASHQHAQRVLSAALAAGFRESGAVGLSASDQHDSTPVVAVRSSGLGFDAIIGLETGAGRIEALVDEAYLHILLGIANERFSTNARRIARFHDVLFQDEVILIKAERNASNVSEDPDLRRQRKKLEGLQKQEETLARKRNEEVAGESFNSGDVEIINMDRLFN